METFGSKLKISIGRIQPKSPIRFSLNLIFSLEFQWSLGGQKANEIPIKISSNDIFPRNSMGFWWAETRANHLWNPDSPWYFKRHFTSQIPDQNQFRFDIFPRNSIGFGEQKTKQIISGTQIPLGISKGISQAKVPIKITSCFRSIKWFFLLFCICFVFRDNCCSYNLCYSPN